MVPGIPRRLNEPLRKHVGGPFRPRVFDVADKPRQRRVSALRPGCASGVVRVQRHLAHATEQHHRWFRLGVEAAARNDPHTAECMRSLVRRCRGILCAF